MVMCAYSYVMQTLYSLEMEARNRHSGTNEAADRRRRLLSPAAARSERRLLRLQVAGLLHGVAGRLEGRQVKAAG